SAVGRATIAHAIELADSVSDILLGWTFAKGGQIQPARFLDRFCCKRKIIRSPKRSLIGFGLVIVPELLKSGIGQPGEDHIRLSVCKLVMLGHEKMKAVGS